MATEAQHEANKANAQQSTGPRTEAGKQHSSQNARKHGLTARDFVVAPEDQDEFAEHLEKLGLQFRPCEGIEHDVFLQLVQASWNIHRIRRMESELWQNEPNLLDTEAGEIKLNRLARYQGHNERSYYRALKELEKLQTNTALVIEHDVLETISPVVNIALLKRTQSRGAGKGIISPLPPRAQSPYAVPRN